MSPRAFVPALLLAGAAVALVPAALSGQAVPVGNAVTLCPVSHLGPGYFVCGDVDVTALSTGGFAIASDWDFVSSEDERESVQSCRVDLVNAAGRPQDSIELDHGHEIADYMPEYPFVAGDGEGGFVVGWSQWTPQP